MWRVVLGAVFAPTVLACLWSGALAQQEPAVSGINGKFEFDAGLLTLPAPTFLTRAAGTLTLPLGQAFGFQADVSVATAPSFTTGGALHLFTRDPQSHLIGGTLGFVRTPGAIVFAAGPEAELYFDRWTIEAWGGLSYARPSAGPDRLLPFVMADVAAYPTDNWRLSLGISSLDGYNAVHAGSEYLLDDFALPLSLTADARLGQDGALLATLGLRGYLGGTPKSLIRRHREDDPADRGTSLYSAVGGSTVSGDTTAPSPNPDTGTGAPPQSPPASGFPPPVEPVPPPSGDPDTPSPSDREPPVQQPPADPDPRQADPEPPMPEDPAPPVDGGDDGGPDLDPTPPDVSGPGQDEPCEDAFEFTRNPVTGECEPFLTTS